MGAPARHQLAAVVFGVFGFVDGEQLVLGGPLHLRGGAGDQFEGQTVEIERHFVTGDSLPRQGLVVLHQHGITLGPRKIGFSHQDAANLGAMLQPMGEIEIRAFFALGQEDQARIKADQILSVPNPVIVMLLRIMLFEPGAEMIVVEKVQLEVNMGAFPGDACAGVAGAAHHSDFFARFHRLARFEAAGKFLQVGVEGINLEAADAVAQNDVAAVIGKGGPVVHIRHRAVGRGHDRVGRFAALVPLQAFDVQALVHLPSAGTNASKAPACPGMAGGPDKKFLLPAFLEQGLVGSGQMKRLRQGREPDGKKQAGEKNLVHINREEGGEDSLKWFAFLFLANDISQAPHNAEALCAGGVRREAEQAVGDALPNQHRSEPAGLSSSVGVGQRLGIAWLDQIRVIRIVRLFLCLMGLLAGRGKLREDDDVLAFVVGGVHIQQQRPVFVEKQLNVKTAIRIINDRGFGQVAFIQERIAFDRKRNFAARYQHRAGGRSVRFLPLNVQADGGLLLFPAFLPRALRVRGATSGQGKADQRKINIE